jgi:hypothetical protein
MLLRWRRNRVVLEMGMGCERGEVERSLPRGVGEEVPLRSLVA